ncbi:MAG: ABC transporter permease, partial [Caldilineaceae bacterium]|nr:ABC transporter permease [Caldilineaceae bacterium]
MLIYLVRRLIVAVPTFFAVLFITFTLTTLSPFDPVQMMMQRYESSLDSMQKEEVIERIRDQYGLNDPYLVQFGSFVKRLLSGDLGTSINGQRDVLRSIVVTFPISFQLGLAGACLTALIGIPLGALAARMQNTWLDYTIVGGTLVFRSIPVFVLAP